MCMVNQCTSECVYTAVKTTLNTVSCSAECVQRTTYITWNINIDNVRTCELRKNDLEVKG